MIGGARVPVSQVEAFLGLSLLTPEHGQDGVPTASAGWEPAVGHLPTS